jgi:hypothetical protein
LIPAVAPQEESLDVLGIFWVLIKCSTECLNFPGRIPRNELALEPLEIGEFVVEIGRRQNVELFGNKRGAVKVFLVAGG